MALFRETCIARMSTQCSILSSLNEQETVMVRPPLGLALASLGATLVGSSHFKNIWIHAHRMLIVGIAINNQMTRNHYAYLAWILIDMTAAVATDPDITRLANTTQGMIKAAMRRCWQVQQIQPNGHRHGHVLGQLLSCLLQADLVRSLRMHTVPSTISAFGAVPLNSTSNLTFKDIVTSVSSQREVEWTFESQEVSFLKLLVILNELVIHALVLHRLHGNSPSSIGAITSLTVSEEIRRSHDRLQHALSSWHAGHFPRVDAQLQALYQFCELYLLMPGLHLLPAETRSKFPIGLQDGSNLDSANQPHLKSSLHHYSASDGLENKPAKTVHRAWLLYESVSCIPPKTPAHDSLYLPVIAFLAGLCIWENIVRQGSSRAQGSTKVLRLFSLELRKMSWPCCCEMADSLDSLA